MTPRPAPYTSHRYRLAVGLVGALSVALVASACSGESVSQGSGVSEETPAVVREAGGIKPSLPKKIPKEPLEAVNVLLESAGFYEGLLNCFTDVGCFAEDDTTQRMIEDVTAQIEDLKAEVSAGIAATRIDVARGDYARAERGYDDRYGTHIAEAMRFLDRMSDPSLSEFERNDAREDFLLEARVLVPATAASAIRGFLTSVGGNGGAQSNGGLLGAAWNLITATERSVQGDAKGEVPVFLPAKSANLMLAIGTQRLLEGTQLVTIALAYEVLSDPDLYEGDLDAQDALRQDLRTLWLNGSGTVPGAAAITAALPRELPNQSGVFTQGFGDDVAASDGLLVRNFGPTVDAASRPGPIVNADAGYSMAAGIDEWLDFTRRNSGARRELILARAGDTWSYAQATGALTTTVTSTDFPRLKDELGTLIATHGTPARADDVATFARLGTVFGSAIGWDLDIGDARISVREGSGLCLANLTRSDGYSPVRGYDKLVSYWRPIYAPGPSYGEPSVSTSYVAPRLRVTPCANDTRQQWFLQGPVPLDGLPFDSPSKLLSLSETNAEAIEAGYPIEFWSVLTPGDARTIFRAITARAVDPTDLFMQYGSALTPAVERALPPVLRLPVKWLDFTGSDQPQVLQRDAPVGVEDRNRVKNADYSMSGVAFPVSGGQFFVRPLNEKPFAAGYDTITEPGLSTAAILGMPVEPCIFSFLPPRGTSFSCQYKDEVRDMLAIPGASLSTTSPLNANIGSAPSRSPSASPGSSPSASPTVSPGETTSPSATPSPGRNETDETPEPEESPQPEESPAPGP